MASMLSLALAGVLSVPVMGQANTPLPCPERWDPPDPSVAWETESASLQAEAIEMRRGDCFFAGVGPAMVDSDPGDPTYRTLEVDWLEQGIHSMLNIYFAADQDDWWVTEIRTPAAEFHDHPSLPYHLSELTRTPRGESLEGDLLLENPDGSTLALQGLRLTAFAPGTGPAPLSDCVPAATTRKALREGPFARGGALRGLGLRKKTPAEAEALLRELGYCFSFRYVHPIEGTDGGWSPSDRWCTAPPGGTIEDATYLDNGELVVFVDDDEPRPWEPAPPQGMGCPVE